MQTVQVEWTSLCCHWPENPQCSKVSLLFSFLGPPIFFLFLFLAFRDRQTPTALVLLLDLAPYPSLNCITLFALLLCRHGPYTLFTLAYSLRNRNIIIHSIPALHLYRWRVECGKRGGEAIICPFLSLPYSSLPYLSLP